MQEVKRIVEERKLKKNNLLRIINRHSTLCIVTTFFNVCTSNLEINVRRITQLFKRGYEVPILKIISRYYKSLLNAQEAVSLVDRAYIYDNSVENQLPRLLFRTVDGTIFKQYTKDIPE